MWVIREYTGLLEAQADAILRWGVVDMVLSSEQRKLSEFAKLVLNLMVSLLQVCSNVPGK